SFWNFLDWTRLDTDANLPATCRQRKLITRFSTREMPRMVIAQHNTNRLGQRNAAGWAAGCLLLLLFTPGCNVWYLAKRTVFLEPEAYRWYSENAREHQLYTQWADEAWGTCLGDGSVVAVSPDYEQGFRDGFVDFVYAGGSGEPPPVPPRRYWRITERTGVGTEPAKQWAEGFRRGAMVAHEGGYRDRAVLPVTQVIRREALVGQAYNDEDVSSSYTEMLPLGQPLLPDLDQNPRIPSGLNPNSLLPSVPSSGQPDSKGQPSDATSEELPSGAGSLLEPNLDDTVDVDDDNNAGATTDDANDRRTDDRSNDATTDPFRDQDAPNSIYETDDDMLSPPPAPIDGLDSLPPTIDRLPNMQPAPLDPAAGDNPALDGVEPGETTTGPEAENAGGDANGDGVDPGVLPIPASDEAMRLPTTMQLRPAAFNAPIDAAPIAASPTSGLASAASVSQLRATGIRPVASTAHADSNDGWQLASVKKPVASVPAIPTTDITKPTAELPTKPAADSDDDPFTSPFGD
ncbi:MAG: hypothetical protein KDA99_29820, partial [Planctomycetales bacterium]|nr:hypothetical protein [Planctomycetales bacterium]